MILRDNNMVYHSDCLANTNDLVKDVKRLELICDQLLNRYSMNTKRQLYI